MSASECRKRLLGACPTRLGANLEQELNCVRQLYLVNHYPEPPVDVNFKQYDHCLKASLKKVVDYCISFLQNACLQSSVRAIKTVRLSMETVVELKKLYPHLKIIHLLRDPKATVLSRIRQNWAVHGSTERSQALTVYKYITGTLGGKSLTPNASVFPNVSLGAGLRQVLVPEMRIFCRMIRRNEITRRHIEQQFPGTTYVHLFEDLFSDPVRATKQMLNFVGNNTADDSVLEELLKPASEWKTKEVEKKQTYKLMELRDVFHKHCAPYLGELLLHRSDVKTLWEIS